jgi:DNA (cytosine-5)-methyltransferase 1
MTYNILDLFCGAGGLSLGFEKAGFSVVKAVDIDPWAIQTYNFNRKDKVAEVLDVSKITKEYLETLGTIDGIIGGPPCQGFSIANGQRIIDDDRNKLYREYFKILEEAKPKFFIIENVPGLLNLAKGAVRDDIIRRASKLGYKVEYKVVNAALYGVPQSRLRVIFVGIHESCNAEKFVFPEGNSEPVSIEDAIGDLPSLDNGGDNTRYVHAPKTEYQRVIRDGMTELHNHILSIHTEETKRTIALIPEGKRVCDLPEELRGNRKYEALMRKMDRSKPAVTIDTGHRTYFHYQELRIPSTREVARLQSFPDSYIFIGPRNDQQKQVGNAVPPMLARIIAEAIYKHITKE